MQVWTGTKSKYQHSLSCAAIAPECMKMTCGIQVFAWESESGSLSGSLSVSTAIPIPIPITMDLDSGGVFGIEDAEVEGSAPIAFPFPKIDGIDGLNDVFLRRPFRALVSVHVTQGCGGCAASALGCAASRCQRSESESHPHSFPPVLPAIPVRVKPVRIGSHS